MNVLHRDAYPRVSSDRGIERHTFPGFNSRLIVCAKGCVIPSHPHERSEEIFVLSGKVRLNEHILGPGDLLRTEVGEEHEAEALADSRFLVMNTLDPR